MDTSRRELLRVVLWFVTLVAAIALFLSFGGGRLAAPDLAAPSTWAGWAGDREPVEAVFALLRLLVLGLAWYLLGVLTMGTAARLLRSARLIRVADALTIPLVRRGLEQAMGLTLATVVVASAAGGGQFVPQHDDGPAIAMGDELIVPDDAEPMALERLAGGQADATIVEPMSLQFQGVEEMAQPLLMERMAGAAEADVHTVVAGDHLWSVAEDHLTSLGIDHDDDDVAAHVDRIVAANPGVLVDPGNADLILPGQEFVLPAATS